MRLSSQQNRPIYTIRYSLLLNRQSYRAGNVKANSNLSSITDLVNISTLTTIIKIYYLLFAIFSTFSLEKPTVITQDS